MGLMRFLVIVAALWLLFVMARVFIRKSARGTGSRRERAEKVVPCAYCGTYLPISDAVSARGASFCCEEHARAAEPRA